MPKMTNYASYVGKIKIQGNLYRQIESFYHDKQPRYSDL